MKANLLPEAVCPDRPYPLFADLKLNAWAIAALGAAVLARCLVGAHPEWDPIARATVALAPLVPSWLYVRQLGRWIRGLDEMQRRIQLEAALFGTVVALFAVTAVSLLGGAGALPTERLGHGLGWEGAFVCAVAGTILGNLVVQRRYR